LPKKSKPPIKGLRSYLYEALVQVKNPAKDPEHFEMGDEVIDGLDTPQRYVFADLVNGVARRFEIVEPNYVRRSKAEFKAEAGDWTKLQRDEFVKVLNHIFEQIREEPDKVYRLPHFQEYESWLNAEDTVLKIVEADDKYANETAGVALADAPVVQLTESEQELLKDPMMLEKLVSFGESLVRDTADVWRALFLASASAYAPPILANGSDKRAQIHIFLLGDPSTAKSSLLKDFTKLSPKCRIANDITYAGFVGTVQRGVPVKGEAAELDRGVLCIDEFEKFYKNHYRNIDGVLRAVMEDSHIRRRLALGTVDDDTRTVILACANPKNDVFSDTPLADQMPIPIGLLSRFDYFRPLAYSQFKIAQIGQFMASIWFKPKQCADGILNHEKVYGILVELRKEFEKAKITRVQVPDDLVRKVEKQWESRLEKWNVHESKGIPLLSNRDLASLYRFLNASAVLHICQRQIIDGAIVATETDADIAVLMLDQLVLWRKEYLNPDGKRARIAECNTERVQRIIDRHKLPRMDTTGIVHSLELAYDISERTAYYWLADYRRATGQEAT